MYEKTDRLITYMDKQLIRLFSEAKAQLSIDEINALQIIKRLYADADELIRRILRRVALEAYSQYVREQKREIDNDWVEYYLTEYDPTSKYIYVNEIDRKEARLFEAVMASENKGAEIDSALKSVSLMGRIYAVRVTDEAVLEAYRDNGTELVSWESEDDSRVCPVCFERDGKIYPIEDLPPKPHINCRCWYREVVSGETGELTGPRES